MNYEEWNSYLTDHFFYPEMAGREVILFADDSLINRIGAQKNVDVDNFIDAIRRGLSWSRKSTVPQKAYETYEWTIEHRTKPLYIGYLVFFVLAAGAEGDYSGNAFYPRINQLLEPTSAPFTSANFQRMHKLWEALEVWTKETMFESLGCFTARIRGSWVHVGMPWSQLLLNSDERGSLPRIFAEHGFDPTSPPGENTIAKALLQSSAILARTRKVLNNATMGDGHFRQALLDLVMADLRSWNGDVPGTGEDPDEKDRKVFGSIRLCLDYDYVAQVVQATMRFKVNRDLPEEEMYFIRQKDHSQWVCTGSLESWTTEFYSSSSNGILDAGKLDWNCGEVFIDESNQWQLTLKPCEAKLFMIGTKEGLSKWVETNRLLTGEHFLIAVNSQIRTEVHEWGIESCQSFQELRVSKGLPTGWSLYEITNATMSHPIIDILQLPTSTTIRFVGGIKTRPGNKFFPFALPKINVEGITEQDSISVYGRDLIKDRDELWTLPEDLPKEQPIIIELLQNDQTYRASFQIEDSTYSHDYMKVSRDRFGVLQKLISSNCFISGAVVEGTIISDIPAFQPILPTFLANRMIFLGGLPGQFCDWPTDGLPKEWEPLWAIIKVKRDKYQAIFVGSNYNSPVLKDLTRPHNWKKWKKVFLYRDVLPPELLSLKCLWEAFKKEAKKL